MKTPAESRSPQPRTAVVPAFAKLNLGLRVLYRRPDNYHELRTVFQTISLKDRLTVSFTPARRREIVVEGTPDIAENLAARAALLVIEASQKHGVIAIHLRKNIPMGAGLGGGSSDAAAVLLSLPVLMGARIAPDRLAGMAAQLGSDVLFFLQGGTALGFGRGEELYPLPDLPPWRALVVAPDVHSSTAEAYKSLSEKLTSIGLQNKLVSFQQELWSWAGDETGGGLSADSNDFESVVFERYPALRRIRQRLENCGAEVAAMSGSGSAVFGVFRDKTGVERAQKSLPGEKMFEVTFVTRARYRSAWRRALKTHINDQDALNQNTWPPRSRYAR